ncbi:MAG: hypothetical protein HY843_08010 [Bdellovibrio sp.]|nr:hypothetical protein [Bdellovibrio sp.]
MKYFRIKWLAMLFIASITLSVTPARSDFWGGDVIVLGKILAESIKQLTALNKILGNGQDSFRYLKDINKGISDALNLLNTMNSSLHSGQFGNINDPTELMRALQELYGAIPKTSEAKVQAANDQGATEAIVLHNQAFEYASQIDPEAERIKDYARNVSPQGAAKLTAQSLGVLIHVTNQLLRTNAAILKVLGQNLAMENKKEKLNSDHFRIQYEDMSRSLNQLRGGYDLDGRRNP